MQLIEGNLRTYAWGSRSALAALTGRPIPTPHPEAEMWFGAHPGAPSDLVEHEGNLLELIESDPEAQLGGGCRLPFLLKLLAAEEALSIQVHPTKAQAEEGFARENAEGIPAGAKERNYKDDNHKPELLVALTDFEAMTGFRSLERTQELFAALDIAELRSFAGLLGSGDDEADLRGVLTTLVTLPTSVVSQAIEAVRVRCEEIVASTGARAEECGEYPQWIVETADLFLRLRSQYGVDRGVLCALLLNRVLLAPGEAIFLEAGELHAYVHGLGVEIMANSDNVLRGGLTTKHVDVPELMKVVRCIPLADPTLHPDAAGFYRTPASEFELQRVSGPSFGEVAGPAIVLSVSHGVEVADERGAKELSAGQAVWVSAGEEPVRLSLDPRAVAFIARMPEGAPGCD